jgi:uncharacterized BrkB/YihY/UPF0761 family membrane protein
MIWFYIIAFAVLVGGELAAVLEQRKRGRRGRQWLIGTVVRGGPEAAASDRTGPSHKRAQIRHPPEE